MRPVSSLSCVLLTVSWISTLTWPRKNPMITRCFMYSMPMPVSASILRQVEEAGIRVDGKGNYKRLTEPVEIDLIKKLGEYPEMLAQAAADRAVQQVAHYVYDLAGLFHSAYNQCRILGVDEELQQARLAMVLAVGHVLRHGLDILGVSAPEKM